MATDLPNPFWSEAVQQEFQRTQQQAETAGDRDATTMREIDETQQEPNYQLESREQVPSGAVGLTAQDQTVFQAGPVSSNDSGNMPGHGSVQVQPTITSPAPRSVAGLSDFSNMERGLGLREARVDNQELVPDYASMPAPPGLQSALLTGMGDMMRELLQTQLTAQLAPVFERLGRLESERSSEVSAVSALEAPERMTLARVEARQTEAQVAVPVNVADPTALGSKPGSSAVDPAALAGRPSLGDEVFQAIENVPGRHDRSAQDVHMEPATNPENIRTTLGQGQGQQHHQHQGVVQVDGVEYAWRLTPEGLKLEKTQKAPQVRAASVADIFHARARSPFEVVTPIRTPKRDREPRTRSDSPRRTQPQQVRTADQLLGLDYQQGFSTTTAPPPVPEHLRKSRVSPSRGRSGRLVYPVSPGGTEIRPPPPPETAIVPHVAAANREPEEPVRFP